MENALSGIILAGGLSRRMGCDKAALPLGDLSFLEHQRDKLRALGIDDILVAGSAVPCAGTRFVPDRWPQRGPLGGLHAGLAAAEHAAALVLPVDTPLVPVSLLRALAAAHRGGVTLAAVGDELEPLIGVYDTALAPLCETLLRGERCAVRRLFPLTQLHTLPFAGDPRLLMNCNTPEDYAQLQTLYLSRCEDPSPFR